MESWVAAFPAALGLTLLGIPLLRRLALATGFVDRPASHKSHTEPIPYLGGIAIITAVLLAILVHPRLPAGIGPLAFASAAIGTIGLVDDDRSLAPLARLLAQTAVAIVPVAIGLRIHATGVGWVDVVITLVWIVGITNAMNLIDNMDGLAGGVGAAVSLCLLGLAHAQGRPVTATVAAAVAGACLGFLAYNRPPASVFMGDAGSLFLGFVVAALAVEVSGTRRPDGLAIPVTLLCVPILDTATVTLARLRRGLPISVGRKDHLSHRLLRRGLSPDRAVGLLVGTQAAVGTVGVLAALRVVRLGWALVVVGLWLFGLILYTARANVYGEEP